MMGARVTSADISERQLENASVIAGQLGLDIEFICDDTMQLSRIRDRAYDMVYTSNGTLSWISDIDSMNRNIYRVLKTGGYSVTYDMHPFNRPFSGEAWKTPQIIKSYHDVFPDLHWRLQDIINAQIKAGLNVCELAELPAKDASFWFTYAELQEKNDQLISDTQRYALLWEEAKQSLAQYKEEMAVTRAQQEENLRTLNDKNTRIAELTQQLEEISGHNEVLRSRCEELTRRAESAEAAPEEAQRAIRELEAKNRDIESSFFDIQMENIHLKNELENLRKQLNR